MVLLRLLLRIFLLLCLVAFSGGAGFLVATFRNESEITRIREERDGYRALAEKTTSMSNRALVFALKYQEVLDTCLAKLYSRPAVAPVIFATQPVKGGIGGPDDVRKPGRLP